MDSNLLSAHTHTHTCTYHSKIMAKHTANYVWTVSPTDQTHVESLTFDLSAYDYSSSSDWWARVAMLLHSHTLESIHCLLFNIICFLFIYLREGSLRKLIVFSASRSHSHIQSHVGVARCRTMLVVKWLAHS